MRKRNGKVSASVISAGGIDNALKGKYLVGMTDWCDEHCDRSGDITFYSSSTTYYYADDKDCVAVNKSSDNSGTIYSASNFDRSSVLELANSEDFRFRPGAIAAFHDELSNDQINNIYASLRHDDLERALENSKVKNIVLNTVGHDITGNIVFPDKPVPDKYDTYRGFNDYSPYDTVRDYMLAECAIYDVRRGKDVLFSKSKADMPLTGVSSDEDTRTFSMSTGDVARDPGAAPYGIRKWENEDTFFDVAEFTVGDQLALKKSLKANAIKDGLSSGDDYYAIVNGDRPVPDNLVDRLTPLSKKQHRAEMRADQLLSDKSDDLSVGSEYGG